MTSSTNTNTCPTNRFIYRLTAYDLGRKGESHGDYLSVNQIDVIRCMKSSINEFCLDHVLSGEHYTVSIDGYPISEDDYTLLSTPGEDPDDLRKAKENTWEKAVRTYGRQSPVRLTFNTNDGGDRIVDCLGMYRSLCSQEKAYLASHVEA